MAVELDHVFVCTEFGAPEADRLAALGLAEGAPNRHPGQGTRTRRFFVHNAMLELLWVDDEAEARSPACAPLRLWERWRYAATGYSPFGVCVRPRQGHAPGPALPFATWPYRPPYLPPGLHIDIATGTAPGEPLLFALGAGERPDALVAGRGQPLAHPGGFREITRLCITLPGPMPALSGAARALQEAGVVGFVPGQAHLAEIELDHGRAGQRADFRPVLPLRFQW